jgi:hypothetical protein
MSERSLPPLQPYAPTTFLERGVAVPFTSPQLFGARARPKRIGGMELILPNPSGGRGVYVLDWSLLREFCRPTVHDRHLITRVAGLTSITPATIRQVATAIAADGMAGERAMAAALAIIEAERDELIVGNYVLLMTLVEQVGPPLPSGEPAETEMEQRAQRAGATIGRRMDRTPAWVAGSLEALTEVLRPVGVRAQTQQARIRRVLELLRAVREEIAAWGEAHAGSILADYAGMIRSAADLTLSLTQTMLDAVDAMTADTINLLEIWARDPESVIRAATRPEWMLDGWEQIGLLWRQATDPAAQRVALAEIAVLVPVVPREVIDWAGINLDGTMITHLRRLVPLNEDWRTGATVFELIARNEALRSAGS